MDSWRVTFGLAIHRCRTGTGITTCDVLLRINSWGDREDQNP